MFELNMDANPTGTSLRGYFDISYKELAAKFGPGDHVSGDNKVHIEWIFDAKELGQAVTLYEYKNIYPYGDKIAIEAFKNLPSFKWHIGAESRAVAQLFAGWLRNQLDAGTFIGD